MPISAPVKLGTAHFSSGSENTNKLTTSVSAPAGADLFVALFPAGDPTGATVTDVVGNTYVNIGSIENTGGPIASSLYLATNCIALPSQAAAMTTVTPNCNNTLNAVAFYVDGAKNNDLLQTATAISTTSNPITMPTSSVSGEIYIGICNVTSKPAITEGSGWTILNGLTSDNGYDVSYLINAGTGSVTYNPTISLTEKWASLCASFKPIITFVGNNFFDMPMLGI